MRIKVSCTRCLPSCPSPLPRSASCRKTTVAGSRGQENQSSGDEHQNKIKLDKSCCRAKQLLSHCNYCLIRLGVLQGATRCYKVLQDVTYSYSTCQVIPLHLQERTTCDGKFSLRVLLSQCQKVGLSQSNPWWDVTTGHETRYGTRH